MRRGRRCRDAARLHLGLVPFGLKRLRSPAAIVVIALSVGLTTGLSVLSLGPGGCSGSAAFRCGVAGGLTTSLGLIALGSLLVAAVAAQVVKGYLRTVVAQCNEGPWNGSYSQGGVLLAARARSAREISPTIIVGESGAGRSTFLGHLAHDLAVSSWVPVLVAMQAGSTFPGFRELARTAFLRSIDLGVASEDEAERVWRRVCGSGRLVVLVDDLQFIDESEAPRVRAAFAASHDQGYAVIATCRPHGVPRGLARCVTGMPCFGKKEAVDAIVVAAETAPPRCAVPDTRRNRLGALIDRGGFGDSPYYVDVLIRLAAAGALDRVDGIPLGGSLDEIRRGVLDAFADAFVDGALTPMDHSTTAERRRVLSSLETAALDALPGTERAAVDSGVPGMMAAVEAGLLVTEQPGEARIRHALLQNYLASRAIADGSCWRALLAGDFQGSDVLTTMRFWAARADHAERAAAAYDVLLERSSPRAEARALRLLTTAAVISRAASLPEAGEPERRGDRELAIAFAEAWEYGELLDRRSAVESVSGLCDRERFATLSKCAADPDYTVRWAAAHGLYGGCLPSDDGACSEELDLATLRGLMEPAFAAATDVAEAIRAGREDPDDVDDWDERVRPLVGLGWVLPTIGTLARDDELRSLVWEYFERMLYLFEGGSPTEVEGDAPRVAVPVGGITAHRGPEATIAQGLKTAATLAESAARADPASVVALSDQLCGFYETTKFWYSRVVLLQGLAELSLTLDDLIRSSGGGVEREGLREATVRVAEILDAEAASSPPRRHAGRLADARHPFVVATATLCVEGLERAREEVDGDTARVRLRQYIWVDEAEAIATEGAGMDPSAVRLLGAITTLLNLIERGDHSQRKKLPVRTDLPGCLARGEDLRGLAGAKDSSAQACGCGFGLCTKRPPVSRGAVRELSKGFCRRAQAAADVKVSGWDTSVKASSVRRFWKEMERQAER